MRDLSEIVRDNKQLAKAGLNQNGVGVVYEVVGRGGTGRDGYVYATGKLSELGAFRQAERAGVVVIRLKE